MSTYLSFIGVAMVTQLTNVNIIYLRVKKTFFHFFGFTIQKTVNNVKIIGFGLLNNLQKF